MATLKLDDKVIIAGSAFAAGIAVGMFAKGAAKRMSDAIGSARGDGVDESTITYRNNLPPQFQRRDPAPGEPRFGGTGALGVSPEAVQATRPDQL